jgi:protein SCO1
MKYASNVVGIAVIALGLMGGAAQADGKPLAARVGVDEHVGVQLPSDVHITDEHGRSFQLSDFARDSKPTLLSLAYYHCPGLCDISLRELATTLRDSGWKLGDDYRALTVSIDPHDTSASAGAKRANVMQLMHVQSDTLWPFTVTDSTTLQRLTQTLGYRYDYDPPTHQYAHPAVSIVLTPDAKVSRYLYGPTLETRDVALALREARLGRGGASALVDRTVLSCFQYDPVSRRYSLLILGVMRVGAALIALLLTLFIFIYSRRGRLRRASL